MSAWRPDTACISGVHPGTRCPTALRPGAQAPRSGQSLPARSPALSADRCPPASRTQEGRDKSSAPPSSWRRTPLLPAGNPDTTGVPGYTSAPPFHPLSPPTTFNLGTEKLETKANQLASLEEEMQRNLSLCSRDPRLKRCQGPVCHSPGRPRLRGQSGPRAQVQAHLRRHSTRGWTGPPGWRWSEPGHRRSLLSGRPGSGPLPPVTHLRDSNRDILGVRGICSKDSTHRLPVLLIHELLSVGGQRAESAAHWHPHHFPRKVGRGGRRAVSPGLGRSCGD